MKRLFLGLCFGGAGLVLAACESQRTSTVSETATTSETVTTAPAVTTPDTVAQTPTDAGEISEAVAATGTFTSDADFAAKAVESGMAEVKFGNLADRKAVNPDVKKFGIEMVQEHTRANAILMRLTRTRKWPTPEEMDVAHQQAYSKLATVMSDEFDQGYMDQMVKDHEMAVALFQQGSAKVTDPELKTYITNTLPALKRHLGMARDLQKKIEAAR